MTNLAHPDAAAACAGGPPPGVSAGGTSLEIG